MRIIAAVVLWLSFKAYPKKPSTPQIQPVPQDLLLNTTPLDPSPFCARFIEGQAWIQRPHDEDQNRKTLRFGVMVDTRRCGTEIYEATLWREGRGAPMEVAWVKVDEPLPGGLYTTYDALEYTIELPGSAQIHEFTILVRDGDRVLGAKRFQVR